MKSIVGVLAVLFLYGATTAHSSLDGANQTAAESCGTVGVVSGDAANSLNIAVTNLLSTLTAKLIVITQPVISINTELDSVVGSSLGSVLSILNSLSGAIANSLAGNTAIVSSITAIGDDVIRDLNAAIEKICLMLIEIVQTINFACAAGSTVSSFDGVITAAEAATSGLINDINALIKNVIAAFGPLAASPTSADAKAIASILLVLQSTLQIVSTILTSTKHLISRIASNPSGALTVLISAIDQSLSRVDSIVSQLSTDANADIEVIVRTLEDVASQLLSDVSSAASSIAGTIVGAIQAGGSAIGNIPDVTQIVSKSNIDPVHANLLSNVAAPAIYGVVANIESVISSIDTALPGIDRALNAPINYLKNAVGSILALIVTQTGESWQKAAASNGIADLLLNAVNGAVAPVQNLIIAIETAVKQNGSVSAPLAAVLENVICAVIGLVKSVAGVVVEALTEILPSTDNIADKITGNISGALNNLASSITGTNLGNILNGLSSSVSALANYLTETLSGSLGIVADSGPGVAGTLIGRLGGVFGVLITVLKNSVGEISAVVAGVAKDAISLLVDRLNDIIKNLDGILLSLNF